MSPDVSWSHSESRGRRHIELTVERARILWADDQRTPSALIDWRMVRCFVVSVVALAGLASCGGSAIECPYCTNCGAAERLPWCPVRICPCPLNVGLPDGGR